MKGGYRLKTEFCIFPDILEVVQKTQEFRNKNAKIKS